MIRRATQSRILASLLALAVFVSQTSVVFAAFEMFPVNSEKSHCIMNSTAADSNRMKDHSLSKSMNCCETSECASNLCVPGFSSSSVLINPVLLIHGSIYARTTLDTTDQLQSGIEASSPYRPPRHSI